jgi:dTDP-4-amino-4,6-dideoxygalactose transaminase
LSAICALTEEYELDLVEDACQAHGARVTVSNGMASQHMAGSVGRFGAFSMYPGKNLGAMGEAGAVITNEPELAERVRLLANHGQTERYIHSTPDGVNGRLDALQAAVLDIKLKRLAAWNDCRREVAAQYAARLAGSAVETPTTADYGEHVYHIYMVQVDERDRVRQELAQVGVETGLHYPVPLHLQTAYQHLEHGPGSFPVTERVAERLLSLPMFPHMRREQVDYVCEQLLKVVG